MEPLLQEEEGRHVLFPIRDQEVWERYKRLEGAQWTAQEISMAADLVDWPRLSEPRRRYYGFVLAFFGCFDELVLRNLAERFTQEVRPKECEYFYRAQAQQENVHSEAYSIQIETLLVGAEKEMARRAVEQLPAVRRMAVWADRWMDPDRPFADRLVAFAVVEGVMFQAHFAAIQLLKLERLMPGLVGYNEFIARDEGSHCEFACFLHRERVQARASPGRVHVIMEEAVSLVEAFVDDACEYAGGPVEGITPGQMSRYVRFVADGVCTLMGAPPLYRAADPYPQVTLSLAAARVQKSNQFERRPTTYQAISRPGAMDLVLGDTDPEVLFALSQQPSRSSSGV